MIGKTELEIKYCVKRLKLTRGEIREIVTFRAERLCPCGHVPTRSEGLEDGSPCQIIGGGLEAGLPGPAGRPVLIGRRRS